MTVSVWMISYNQEAYIAQALDSVLTQKTSFDFEIVVGDDCSTDNTRKILKKYQQKYPGKIKLLLHKKNLGMVKNQNLTFLACSGKYVAMLEADDYWTDEYKLQTQYEMMLKYPQCNISFHPVTTTENTLLNDYGKQEKIFSVDDVIVGGGYFIATPSIMLKKEAIRSITDFLKDGPAGDYYIQVLGALRGGALYIPNVMATYRVNASGSWSNRVKNVDIKQRFREQTMSKIIALDHYLNEEFTYAFQKRYLTVGLLAVMDYLYADDKCNYQRILRSIYEYVQQKNLKFWILYMLKDYPFLLKNLSKVYNKLKLNNIKK